MKYIKKSCSAITIYKKNAVEQNSIKQQESLMYLSLNEVHILTSLYANSDQMTTTHNDNYKVFGIFQGKKGLKVAV